MPHPRNPPHGQIPHHRVKRNGRIPHGLLYPPGIAIDRCMGVPTFFITRGLSAAAMGYLRKYRHCQPHAHPSRPLSAEVKVKIWHTVHHKRSGRFQDLGHNWPEIHQVCSIPTISWGVGGGGVGVGEGGTLGHAIDRCIRRKRTK